MTNRTLVSAIIVAAGKGKRMGQGFNKQYIILREKPIVAHTLEVFEKSSYIDDIILVVPKEEMAYAEKEVVSKFNLRKVTKIIGGGKERQDSVYNGLLAVDNNCKIVMVHDGVRPFVNEDLIKKSIEKTKKTGAVILAMPVKDTIKIINSKDEVVDTPNRKKLWAVQTPQTFLYEVLKSSYDRAQKEHIFATDDSMIVEKSGYVVKKIEGSYKNIKITTPEDLIMAEAIIQEGW